MEQSYYLELCNDPIRFDSVNPITDVFFDDSNKQVCVRFHENEMKILVNKSSFE